jgi:hypothetical protein
MILTRKGGIWRMITTINLEKYQKLIETCSQNGLDVQTYANLVSNPNLHPTFHSRVCCQLHDGHAFSTFPWIVDPSLSVSSIFFLNLGSISDIVF